MTDPTATSATRRRRRGLVGAAAILASLVLVLAVAAVLFQGPLALAAMRAGLARQIAADSVAGLPDGLHVALCGTGSPLPDPARSGPCTAVIAGGRVFVVDAGEGASRVLARMRIPMARVEAVLLTHLHSDHFDGLGALALARWTQSAAPAPLSLLGPRGTDRVAAGLNEAYTLDAGWRVAHHGADIVPPAGRGLRPIVFDRPGPFQATVVWDRDGLTITAFPVEHAPVEPALGYRFAYAGRSVVISGDTRRAPMLEAEARGADLLVHEALAPALVALIGEAAAAAGRANIAKIMADIPSYHASPADAAESAQAAGVRALVLTHIVPPLPLAALEGEFLGDAPARFDGPLWLGRDGDLFLLPAGGTAITRRTLLP